MIDKKEYIFALHKKENNHYAFKKNENSYNVKSDIKYGEISMENLLSIIHTFSEYLIDKNIYFRLFFKYENDIDDIDEHIKLDNFERLLTDFNFNKNKSTDDVIRLIETMKDNDIYINGIGFMVINYIEDSMIRYDIDFNIFGILYLKTKETINESFIKMIQNTILTIINNGEHKC